MRMHMRRFTRLTNAFSKKVENHAAAIALHRFLQFRSHPSDVEGNPGMAAGVTDRLWEVSDIVECWNSGKRSKVGEPQFDVDVHKIDGKPFVRVTFPNGETETIYKEFQTRADAIKWIRCEAIVWLWERRKTSERQMA